MICAGNKDAMKTVLDLSSTKAFRYFMEKTLEGVNEETVLAGEKPWEYEGINHKLLIKKDSKYTGSLSRYRPLCITRTLLAGPQVNAADAHTEGGCVVF